MALRDWPSYVGEVRSNYRGTAILMALGQSQTPDLRQGEMVRWHTPNAGIMRHVRDAPGFVGLTAESMVANLWTLGNQPRYISDPLVIKVFSTGIHELLGVDGDTYPHGQIVYMAGTDTQAITTIAGGGLPIGKVYLLNLAPKSGAVRIPVLIDEYTKNPV